MWDGWWPSCGGQTRWYAVREACPRFLALAASWCHLPAVAVAVVAVVITVVAEAVVAVITGVAVAVVAVIAVPASERSFRWSVYRICFRCCLGGTRACLGCLCYSPLAARVQSSQATFRVPCEYSG